MTTQRATNASKLHHGAIGNGQVLALIAPDTRIEWLCMPRFDSPSIFGALLDQDKGGVWAFHSDHSPFSAKMSYIRNTNVLRSVVETRDGICEIFDFAPRIPMGLTFSAPPEIVRIVRPLSGSPRISVQFEPRPDYARLEPHYVQDTDTIEIQGGEQNYFLRTNVPLSSVLNSAPFRVETPVFFVLGFGRRSTIADAAEAQRACDITIAGWRAWAKTCALPRFAAEKVLRSALCLKLHAYQDTGAIIAAATTSIPEALGSERNWDYRYCWLRDSAFVVEALRRLSHLAEGEHFVTFLRSIAEERALQPVYGIGGERNLDEIHLDHLSGFAGNRPVRIGNAAYLQHQNDLMGELILCLDTILGDPRFVFDETDSLWELVIRLVERAIAAYPELDTGPWEYRTYPRHYTFSKALCWVAAHRGARLASRIGKEAYAKKWETWAETALAEILSRGYNEKLGFFTQAFEGQFPDASNLLLPTLGLVEARDPRFISTVLAYESKLVRNGLMLRYTHPDDFGDTTSAFLICSFWWAEALAMMGELDRATEVFDRISSYANSFGLFSEDVDPQSGMLLGNFPQAYTHVGLIHAAITIGELLEARDSRFRAWT